MIATIPSPLSAGWGSSHHPLCSTPRGRGRSTPRISPRPWSCIPHYTLLRKVVRQARHLCAQSAALMCLMGTPHTPLYARRAVRTHGNLWRVPITAQSSTNATDHDAFQPLRGREGFLARPRCAAHAVKRSRIACKARSKGGTGHCMPRP